MTYVTNVMKMHFVLIMSDHITVNAKMDTKVMDTIVMTRMTAKIQGKLPSALGLIHQFSVMIVMATQNVPI